MNRNQKLEVKFFRPFQVLYLVRKQAYKLELLAREKIYNFFLGLLLEYDITKKRQINKILLVPKFEAGNNKKYKIKAI